MTGDALVSASEAAGLSAQPLVDLLELLDLDKGGTTARFQLVRDSVRVREIADAAQVLAVRRARAAGLSWAEVGEALGVSAAGAHARLARLM